MNFSHYIKENKIKAIEIRFLNSKGALTGFTLDPSYLKDKMFHKDFSIVNNQLLKLTPQRSFIDPFLSCNTLVFFTNLKKHKAKVSKLANRSINNNFTVKYCLPSENLWGNSNNFTFFSPQLDTLRNFRDEVVSAAHAMGVKVDLNYCHKTTSKGNIHILSISASTLLDLMDSIEKIKYAIYNVSQIYNVKVDPSLGIFSLPSLINHISE